MKIRGKTFEYDVANVSSTRAVSCGCLLLMNDLIVNVELKIA